MKAAALFLVPLILCFAVSSAFAQSYPTVAEGSGFNIVGSVAFQHPAYSSAALNSPGYTFTIEVLTGTLNASDARLGMNARGGTLSFHVESSTCQVQLYADIPIQVTCSVDLTATVAGQSWNSTFPAGTDIVIAWGYELVPFYVTYWTLGLGIAGMILLFASAIMLAYGVRKHHFYILDADVTMLGVFAIVFFVLGIGMLLYFLLG